MVEKIKSEAMRNASQAELNRARAAEAGLKSQIAVADTVHGQQMDRAKLVQQVRSEREGWLREDRHRDEDRALPAEPEGSAEAPEPQDMISQLVALLSRERRVEFIRDPVTKRITGAIERPQEPQ